MRIEIVHALTKITNSIIAVGRSKSKPNNSRKAAIYTTTQLVVAKYQKNSPMVVTAKLVANHRIFQA